MPYDATIKREAQYVKSLGDTAAEDNFHAVYNGVLDKWFSTSDGYLIDHQKLYKNNGKPEYIVVRHAGGKRNPLLIVELKRPSKFNDDGKKEVMSDLTAYITGRFELTQYSTIYGLGGIGLNWMVCRAKVKGGQVQPPEIVRDWSDDITSDFSYDVFASIASLVYNV